MNHETKGGRAGLRLRARLTRQIIIVLVLLLLIIFLILILIILFLVLVRTPLLCSVFSSAFARSGVHTPQGTWPACARRHPQAAPAACCSCPSWSSPASRVRTACRTTAAQRRACKRPRARTGSCPASEPRR